MATTLALRIASLQTEVRLQKTLIHTQMQQIEKQQGALDVQFRRIADIQAELDLVKATVCLVAPSIAASLLGRTAGPLLLAARA